MADWSFLRATAMLYSVYGTCCRMSAGHGCIVAKRCKIILGGYCIGNRAYALSDDIKKLSTLDDLEGHYCNSFLFDLPLA